MEGEGVSASLADLLELRKRVYGDWIARTFATTQTDEFKIQLTVRGAPDPV